MITHIRPSAQTIARVLATAAVLALATSESSAQGPRQDRIPVVVPQRAFKVFVVRARFTSLTAASVLSVDVVPGTAPERISAPRELLVRLLLGNDCTYDEFNAWHPASRFVEDRSGREVYQRSTPADGRFIFPFNRAARTMQLIDPVTQRRLISVPLGAAADRYCRDFPGDPACGPLRLAEPLLPRLFFTLRAPLSANAGADIGRQVAIQACNAGDGPVTGTRDGVTGGYTVMVALTPFAEISPAEIPVSGKFGKNVMLAGSEITRTQTLKAGGSTVYRPTRAVIPAATPPGRYCLRVVAPNGAADGKPLDQATRCVPIRIGLK